MGGSSRRQRSTSATRRRADRRRACSTRTTVADGEETTTTTTTSVHGLSSILIWILATSSLIVVYPPPSPSHPTSYDAVAAAAEKLILDDITPSLKMYGQYDHQDQQQQPQMVPSKYDFPQFNRRMGLRWRDDDRMRQMFAQPHHQQQPYPMMNPVLTEHHPTHSFGMPSTSSHQGTSYGYNSPTPTLEDIDLIDCLWRNDIAGEKGTTQVSPADQHVRDLQMLTEKSTVETLTTEESLRYEDLSKNFYEGFYNPYSSYPKAHSEQMKATTPDQHHAPTDGSGSDLPTDEDLEELLKEVDHEESELNRVFENKPSENPVINNVSLAEATVYTQSNLTEMQELHDMCNQVNITASSVVSASESATLFNVTDEVTREMWQESDLHPNDLFPQSDYMTVTAQNNTPEAITSNGTFEHAYGLPPISPLSLDFTSRSTTGRQQQTQTSPASATVTAVATQGILEYEGQRNSFSDSTTDSSSPCSGMSSPSYDHESRFYGKLLPHRENFFDRSSTPSRNGAVATKINRVVSSGQRKRGRQSKDEQLASEHSLPVTAHQISEMSLSDLQNVLKMGGLSEYQKQLIRKIRRRGKNKVAARTCRQRRTDRHDKQTNMNHYI
ncbi:hypothetical protein L5515_010875 [Caenorhabditis briggsae]|uniref:BZIP domain-containing protein n=1 Tax=Caenorhabditis briggsae TaxID=6238 RepID=A0AAE9ENA1_CAEBR|nr:hypothetical protein L5515_010875 [Caenorhabditis briggsae]